MRTRSVMAWCYFALLFFAGVAYVLFMLGQRHYKEQDSEYFALVMLVLPALALLGVPARFSTRLGYAALLAVCWLCFYVGYSATRTTPGLLWRMRAAAMAHASDGTHLRIHRSVASWR